MAIISVTHTDYSEEASQLLTLDLPTIIIASADEACELLVMHASLTREIVIPADQIAI